jgi:hypothetical protein
VGYVRVDTDDCKRNPTLNNEKIGGKNSNVQLLCCLS